MFLDVIRRRNPRLIEAAIALHQSGELPANTYVIDLDAIEDHARATSAKASSLGLTALAKTNPMRRHGACVRACPLGGINDSVHDKQAWPLAQTPAAAGGPPPWRPTCYVESPGRPRRRRAVGGSVLALS